jgi:hypothetical protein
MKKVLITLGFLVLQIAPAQADGCPAGARCAVEVNCTTGVTTWHVLPDVPVDVTPRVEPVVVAPTHTLIVKTTNQGFGMSGTPEQIQANVNQMVAKVTAPIEIDPCVNGGCSKVEVNATTQEVTVSSLSAKEIQQRSQDKITNIVREAELAKAATQALPNLQTVEQAAETEEATPLDETDPEWWNLWLLEWAKYTFWFYSYNWQF